MKKKSLALILVATLSLTIIIPTTCAVEEVTEGPYSINTPYEYPVKPGTEAWFALETHGERAAACQIPEEILSNMTTEALVESVVSYPFITDILLFNSAEDGYTIVRDHFNGLQELEVREDGREALSQYYEHMTSTRSSGLSCLEQAAIETTLLKGEFISGGGSNYTLDTSINQFNYAYEIYPELQLSGLKIESRLTYPKTPSGTTLSSNICYYDLPELSNNLIVEYEKEILDNYGLLPDRRATKKYNCHSYAWYSQATTNKWWIDDPTDYINDSYYAKNNSTIKVGNKVVYRTSSTSTIYLHSGIVIGVGGGTGPNIIVQSKWGPSGLYTHNVYNCPAEYGRINTYYKVA